ncbi:MAG: PQQ-binding-like beta-propeller repeat protein [Planctomycetia bacterium]
MPKPFIVAGLLAMAGPWLIQWAVPSDPAACAQEGGQGDDRDADGESADERGVYLPVDRGVERRLAAARRLISESRWSDSATLLDELVAGDRDSFFKKDVGAATWQSVKVEAGRLISSLPPEGRAAYELQFRARADRLLREAVAAGDRSAVAGVARRWLNTPAGQRAALLVALESLEDGQSLTAAAWLDRLHAAGATRFEPTLSIMRAAAWQRAGDPARASAILDAVRAGNITTTRIAGRDVSVSFAAGRGLDWLAGTVGAPPAGGIRAAADWCMHRGDPGRNALSDASRPLLVPRYRVPLTRHPEEATWLEERRKRGADRDRPLVPASAPLAVNGTIILHTPMGLLAVDFETGKRRWLQTGGATTVALSTAAQPDADDATTTAVDLFLRKTLAPVFDDATSGTLASDGRLVFAVESHPDAIIARDGIEAQIRFENAVVGSWNGGNTLAAYDLVDAGRLRWRLPSTSAGREGGAPTWKLGPPLPLGDRLFLLVEELGEVRLDVLDARTGSTLWSQPLVELDEQNRVDNRDNQPRRVAGLSPALAEGVLVCPTGAGAVVAVDLATRTLLWAYHYRVAEPRDVVAMNNGVRLQVPGRVIGGRMVIQSADDGPGGSRRWLDGSPVLANGRVILTPGEADEMHCIDLREGTVAWKRPRNEGLYIAGATGQCVMIVGRRSVEAVSIETGKTIWTTPLAADGGAVCGRALVAADRLFVPLDTPEVVEIDTASGVIVGRSSGRGGAVPGNLVSYRGELLSQAADSLDVFHQTVPLKARIEAAAIDTPSDGDDVWRLIWRGQLQIDQGSVSTGLADLLAAQAAAPDRFPPDTLADAMVFAMERDPAVAAALWNDLAKIRPGAEIAGRGMRVAIDGLLKTGDFSSAWAACRGLVELPAGEAMAGDHLVADGREPRLSMTLARWIQSRVSELRDRGPAEVRSDIDSYASAALDAIRGEKAPSDARAKALVAFIDRFGRHPAAIEARRALAECLADMIAADHSDGDAARSMAVQRDFVLLELLHAGTPSDRESSSAAVAAARDDLASGADAAIDGAWPLGRVAVKRVQNPSHRDGAMVGISRTVPLHVEAGDQAMLPGVRFAFDMQQGGLVVSDGLGRRLGGPLAFERPQPFGMGGFNPSMADVTVIGRVAVVRSGGFVAAYELAGSATDGLGGGHRRLWTAEGNSTIPQPGFAVRLSDRRFPRIGSVPLGMPIPEPEPGPTLARFTALPDSPARVTGVPMLVDGGIQLRDPATGGLVWERRRLPEAGAVFGDDDVLCVCPSNGRGAKVFSMATGRLLRTCDLPERAQRLMTHGRAIVSVTRTETGSAGRAVATSVGLEIIDPIDMRRWQLGEFSGDSRVTLAGGDLAILEPSGRLTIIDLAERRVAFTTDLPQMPKRLERLEVVPWRDRLLVIAGRAETDAERQVIDRICTVTPLPQMTAGGEPITGSIWAVDRRNGQMLWPCPATILRHCLHPDPPSELPVLLFARQIETRRNGERPRLSMLCLDKRTGHAVHADDTLLAQPQLLFGCDAVGDPDRHMISIVPVGVGLAAIEMEFTGEPLAAQQPFQASSKPLVAGDIGTELEYWWNRLLTLPFPF